MKFTAICAAVFVFVAGPVHSANWVPLIGADGMTVEIDSDSIVPAGNGVIKAWIMHSFDEARTSKTYPAFQYKSTLQLDVFNCVERTSDTLQEVYYSEANRQGDVIKSNSYSRKGLDFVDVVPGSVGEGQLEFACNVFKRKQKK